jgi:crotonobetainyl-CoA:carnitine CoA-transferase CaiB-like acyl-CoA transferase
VTVHGPLEGILVLDLSRAVAGPPLRWFDGATEVTPTGHAALPTLGEHTNAVLRWLADD